MNLTVFNSWQSDSPYNSKSIRTALRDASNKLETQIAGLHIKIDEATSNQVGALHIPNAILQNIANADVFVVDLTTVGETFEKRKKLQNPNVLIELGYAISQLGWNRIVLLFNKEFGEFKDLPFDIEKRSCVGFKIASPDDRNSIGLLRESLIVRIKHIIEVNPDKPSLVTTILDKDRANDLKTINKLLAWMPTADMDYLLDEGTDRVKKPLVEKAEQLNQFTESLSFNVTDKMLRQRILKLADAWDLFLDRIPKLYVYKLDQNEFISNALMNGKRKTGHQKTQYLIEDIDKAYVSLLKYIRKNYPEVEI
jgi:hypothetical protein